MSADSLTSAHLADLHERAEELGLPGYRLLSRDELVAAIEAGGGLATPRDEPDDRDEEPAAAEKPAAGGGGRRRRPKRTEAEEKEDVENAEPVSGVLDITGQGHGFLRLEGLERGEADIYVSASQIRRCELREGDEVSGPAREPRRGERHRALVHVDQVNGGDPPTDGRPDFDGLTAVSPSRHLALETDEPLVRAAGVLAPLAYGQRVLVEAAPGSGRTTLLRGIATALAKAENVKFVVLLVDEAPEEATEWRKALPGADLAIATAEMSSQEQLRTAQLALERARRLAERGADAVLIVDSLSRIAAAGDGATVKRIFGSGRELDGEDTGSLTVIATTLDPDDEASKAVSTTENSIIVLRADLAAAGVTPIDAGRTRASNEDKILEPGELEELRALRSELADLEPADAAAKLTERVGT